MRDWVNEIPRDGIIRFLGFFKTERILHASPKARAESLVHKAYDLTKPPQLIKL